MSGFGSNRNLNFRLHAGGLLEGAGSGLTGPRGYLAAFTRDAAVVVAGGFVTTHDT